MSLATRQHSTICLDLVVHGGVDTALHNVIVVGIVGQSNLRRLSWFEEEHVAIAYGSTSRRKAVLVGDVFTRALVGHVVLVVGLLLEQVQLSILRAPVPNLVRELDEVIALAVSARELLAQKEGARLNSRQVKAHVQVGRTGTTLHVEHLHGVVAVILEDVVAVLELKLLFELLVNLILGETTCLVVTPEDVIEGRLRTRVDNVTSPEVD